MSQPEAETAVDDPAREYAVDQFVRRLQEFRYAPGEDAWWLGRRRHERARARLCRAADRALGFEGAVDEAILRFLKIELMTHVLTDRPIDQATMRERMDGICSAQTRVELRDFVRRSTGRPDWDFTTGQQPRGGAAKTAD